MLYRVSGTVGISCHTEVEADSPEEAKAEASRRSLMSAPANMGGEIRNEWIIEEFDCEEPDEDSIRVEEAE